MANTALDVRRPHPGLLMTLVELTDGLDQALPAESRSGGEADALWLSASSLDLTALWDGGSVTRVPSSGCSLARLPLRDYWPIAPLARGSHGEVWKAVRVAPRLQLVALKVLRFDQAHRADRRDRFRREAELAMRLRGPGILPVEEFGEAQGSLFMVMPLVDGATLAHVIGERRSGASGPAARPQAHSRKPSWWAALARDDFIAAMVRIVARIARTLASTHAQRLVHRDVKPANILLDRIAEDRVFLADFGLGRDLDDPTPRPAEAAGTPLYMAPEKLSGHVADEVRSDIYSLGVTLFEAVTLYHPLPVPDGLNQSSLATFLAGTAPLRPRELCPSLPFALEAIILRAIHRDPVQRYGNAAALANDLENCLRDWNSAAVEPLRRRRVAPGWLLRGDVAQPMASPHVHEDTGMVPVARVPRFGKSFS
jgi:serine/threonine-protein kinase